VLYEEPVLVLESMPEIVLVRHAAATGQEMDAPLSAEGYGQATKLADVLLQLGIERIVSSPSRRALESVEPFSRRAGLVIETDQRLTERILSGRSLLDWREHLSRSFDDLDYCLEGGESSRSAQERGTAAVLAASAGGKRCVLVTHGNLLALILRWVDQNVGYDVWSRISNPDVFVIPKNDGGGRGFRRVWGS
jgi:2,3-bisphosphoglycerate-dependent phosphoglycerate mutase